MHISAVIFLTILLCSVIGGIGIKRLFNASPLTFGCPVPIDFSFNCFQYNGDSKNNLI